jgi:drug/metabolite transporter (DMT)-like permease
VANLTHYLSPILVALVAPVLMRVRFRLNVIGAVAAALVGMVLLLQPWETPAGPHAWAGAGIGALSAVFFALQILAGKRSSEGLAPALNLATQRVVSMVLLAPVAMAHLSELNLAQWGYLSAGGVIINGAAGVLFFAGLARSRADLAAGLTLLEPVSAVVIGYVAWHEPITLLGGVGIAMVLASVWLCQHEEEVRPPRPAPSA